MLGKAFDLLGAICDTVELAADFRHWSDDWRWTSSPISFALAGVALLLLALTAYFWGRAGWEALRAAIP